MRVAPLAGAARLRRCCLRPALRGHARELLGLGLIGLVLLGLFGRLIVPGMIAHQRDTGAFYYPLSAWFAGELRDGRFPFWCPLIFGGYPLLADGEIGMLYPANVLALLVLSPDLAFVLTRIAHYLVAGLGTYALARVSGVGRLAAAYAGFSFALGAFMIGHLDHGNIVRSAAWLPALLCCGDLALRARRGRVAGWIALGATSLAFAGLGLHPQVLLINLVGFWSYLPMRALASNPPSRLGRLLLVLGGTTLLGLAGAAVQLVPTYELGQLSSRGEGVPYAKAAAGALSPFDLATLFFPYLFRADPRNVWSLYPYWETTLYVGFVGAVLAPIGLLLGRRRAALPLAGLGLVGLALAMAAHFPIDVYGWIWMLPGFSSMRMPARYSMLIELALAVLAGVGLDRLLAEAGSRPARRTVLGVTASGLVALTGLLAARLWVGADESGALGAIRAGYLSLPHDRAALSAEDVRRGLLATLEAANPWTLLALATFVATVALLWAWQRSPGRGRCWQGAIIAVAATELLLVAHAFHPTTPFGSLVEASRPMRFLGDRDGLWRTFIAGRRDTSVTSRPALFGIAQPYGYSSLPTARTERYWTRVDEVDDELLDLWNGRYLLQSKQAPGRIAAEGVLFDPSRPLLDAPAESPLGQEVFRVAPTHADALRLLSATEGAGGLPNGTAVAEVTVSGGGAPPEVLTIRLGAETAEAAYEDGAAWAHARPAVGYRREPRDAEGRAYARNLYVADVALTVPRVVERVEVRIVVPTGQFRLAGLTLHERSSGRNDSLLPSHREKYTPVYEDESTTIYENRAALPRAFVVGEAVSVEADDWALVYLLQPGFDPRRQVLLEHPNRPDEAASPPVVPPIARAARASEGAPAPRPSTADGATIEQYETDLVVIRATSTRGGHLVLTDSHYPGWRARLDGREVPIERANYLFRAVELPPGEHTVEFSFAPTSVYLGGAMSLVAWLAVAGLGCVGLRRGDVWRGGGSISKPAPPTVAPDKRRDHGRPTAR